VPKIVESALFFLLCAGVIEWSLSSIQLLKRTSN